MNNDRVYYLYQAYLDDIATKEELEEFQSAITDAMFADVLDEAAYNSYFLAPKIPLTAEEQNRKEEVFNRILPQGKPLVRKILWPRIAAAAIIGLAIFGASLFYFNNEHKSDQLTSVYGNDIAAGRTGATLTLANGKKIRLTDAANGDLANEAGVTITKSADGQLVYTLSARANATDPDHPKVGATNTLSTANGETYQVRLPDGSLVDLNAASSLSYSVALNKGEKRLVKLRGEAYFQVAKDKTRPFIVQTAKQSVEVLGTHFNINSYEDEPDIKTTLVEGSVKVFVTGVTKILKPGYQAVNSGKSIKIDKVDPENIIDWKNEDFVLNGVDFRTAMRKIARWYDVQIVYENSAPLNPKIGGWISRKNKISSVLDLIASTGQVHFKIEGRKVIVMK